MARLMTLVSLWKWQCVPSQNMVSCTAVFVSLSPMSNAHSYTLASVSNEARNLQEEYRFAFARKSVLQLISKPNSKRETIKLSSFGSWRR